MSEEIRKFLIENPIDAVNPVEDLTTEEATVVPEETAVAPQSVVSKDQNIRNFLEGQRQELEDETGFFRQMQVGFAEPLQGLAQVLEKTGLPVQFDEDKALAYKQLADKASEDNPILGTLGKLSGLITLSAVVPSVGLAGKSKLDAAVGLGLEGAYYGALQPQYEGYEDTRARDALIGGTAGGVLGRVLGKSKTADTVADDALKQADEVEVAPTPKEAEEATEKLETIINPDNGASVTVKQPVTPIGKAMKAVGEVSDELFGMISTRMGKINQSILKRTREFEFNAKRDTSKYYETSEPFIRTVSRMEDADKKVVDRALKNGEFDTVETVLAKYGDDGVKQFTAVRKMLDEIQGRLVKSGYSTKYLYNYFPRLVKDVKGLRQNLGVKDLDKVDNALQSYAKAKKIKVEDITPEQTTEIIERVIKGSPQTVKKSRRLEAGRTVKVVDDAVDPFYASATESLEAYLRTAAHNINKQEFFNKTAKGFDVNNPNSIQALVAKELDSGAGRDEMISLLQARFINGEMAPNKVVKGLRDMGYATTIANPMSAFIQLADLGQSMVINGVRNTLRSLFGKKDFDVDSVGLRETILEEFESSSKGLDKLFRISGFKRMDRLAKETFINAAHKRAKGMVATEKGRDTFRKKFGALYGDETEQLIQDIAANKPSELVKFHLFNELSGIQPISLLEVPAAYARNPNGRIFYMLKSFTLKQYDILRRSVVDEYRKGNKAEAVKFGVRYAGFISALGGTVQTMRDIGTGRSDVPEALEKLPDRMLWESLSVLGFGTYVADRYLKQGDVAGFAQNVLMPPLNLANAVFTETADIFSEASDAEIEPVLRNTPIVGPALPMMGMWYNFLFGGLENYLAEQDDKNK